MLGKFTFGKIEWSKFKYTGLNIRQNPEGIFVDQNDYVQAIQPIVIDKLADKEEMLTKQKFTEYRALTVQKTNMLHKEILPMPIKYSR